MIDRLENMEALLTTDEVVARVEALADRLAPRLDAGAIGVCLLLGGLWFAADLARALARRSRPLAYDALWLSSYGQGKTSAGVCALLAGPQHSLAGRQILIMDDVADSGVSLRQAVDIVRAAGAAEVLTTVFARKPAAGARAIEPDDFAWDAPARFLVGYGMDLDGRFRDLPFIAAVD
ncbi:MAG TPA: phosphoribosyltransferase family protein [Caulobacteraceae bacterium]